MTLLHSPQRHSRAREGHAHVAGLAARFVSILVLTAAGCGDQDTDEQIPTSTPRPTFVGGGSGPTTQAGAGTGGTTPSTTTPTSPITTLTQINLTPTGFASTADATAGQQSVVNGGILVAFSSAATDLIAINLRGAAQVFVRAPEVATTELISVARDGTAGDNSSTQAALSGNGSTVVFTSLATNLVLADNNGQSDVFARRSSGVTLAVSIAPDETIGNGASLEPLVSTDGRFVAFTSAASNLVVGDTNGVTDVFVRDLSLGVTERVSVTSTGVQLSAASFAPALSANGRFVAFVSNAPELIAGADTNGPNADVFVFDRFLGTTEIVSVSTSGVQGFGAVGGFGQLAISADGRFITFTSLARNLVPGVITGAQIFLRDRALGVTSIISAADNSTRPGTGNSSDHAMSADALFVVFASEAADLVVGDTNLAADIFVRDIALGRTVRVSIAGTVQAPAGSISGSPSIAPDGSFVTWVTTATRLVGSVTALGPASVILAPNPLFTLTTAKASR